ncbi:SWI/SNF-related matrix-associated actin-dependent regulator of chromatin subfamily A containing DEAD/H box 1 homolog isoform X1 [Panulirus ornatus]|uniref:SWI/SNF-related matrix-associated actin-dependent regulator of chromatin subfamily A containing DEAD/H box 1 homolog isoform X1 n=2 Tax=Panulirus ornatus TaxID=150431 RepID=UPI003A8649B2
MEDGGEGATANRSSNINGNISKKKALGGGLRNFRMDKEEANKGQVTLLRYFRNESKKASETGKSRTSPRKDNSADSDSERSTSPILKSHIRRTKPCSESKGGSSIKLQNSSSSSNILADRPPTVVFYQHSSTSATSKGEETDSSKQSTKDEDHIHDKTVATQPNTENNCKDSLGDTSPVLQKRVLKEMDDSNCNSTSKISTPPSTSISQKTAVVQNPSSIFPHRTLSKPLFVGAPSPDLKEEEVGSNNEGDNGEESSSDSPLGGISMRELISMTSPAKKEKVSSSSDIDQDSQDSHVIRMKVVKRVRLVASSDEDEDLVPPAKKQQLNGHNSSSSEDSCCPPDDDTIEKFLQMWECVYPFIEKMEFLDIYRENKWDAKLTMTQLGKLSKQRKTKQRLEKIEEELAKKKVIAEKKEEKKKQKTTEKELESMARAAMKEKLKARKASWKVKAAASHDEQDIEEEEEDYHFGGSKVYDSDEDSGGEEDTKKAGDRQLVLQFFNEASVGELAAIGGCSKKKAEVIVQIRPFRDWAHIVHKFLNERYVSTDLLNEAKTILHVRNTVQKLMKRCENIAKEMQSIVSRIVSGEEDAGISKQPESLNQSLHLKGYQLIGLNWLVLMHEQGLNAVLADEMGLGKTVQAISFLSHVKEVEEPDDLSLIVVPSSTLDNWARELEMWCPSLCALQYHGSQEERRAIRCGIMNNNLEEEPDLILTTYSMVTVNAEDRALFKKLRFHTVILDEAHMLKNMASQRYENLMKIKAQRRILLTGTPLQNNLVELMSILIFVMPQLFDSKKEELKRVFSMFPKSEGDGSKGRFERERIEQAKRIMKPFFLRRLKCDVLKDLPPKEDELIRVPMSQRQQKIYSEMVSYLSKRAQQHQLELEQLNMKRLNELEELEATGGVPKSKEKDRDASSNMVMTLRKIANHPLLTRKYYDDDKILEIAKVLKGTTHRESVLKYIVEDFSVMSDFEIHSTCKIYNPIKRYGLSDELLLSSGKFEQLDILLPKLKDEGARVLIFSQFVILLNILEQYTILRGHKYLRFDGTTQVTERQELIDQFTEDEDIFVFLLSTKAGGLGINLTAANTVILHDIDFNPYNDKQAEDRCHRVGQTRTVKIIRLISKDTIEEGMLQIAQDKLQLERDVTGFEDDHQKKSDVVTLLKDALGIVKTDGQSSSSASHS